MLRLAVLVTALTLLVGPSFAQSGPGSRARELCLNEAERQGVRVLSVGPAREQRDYQDRLKDTVVMLEVDIRGRAAQVRCAVISPSERVILYLPDRDRRADEAIPSLRRTQEDCARAAEREGFRVERVVRQQDLTVRGRISGRETTLSLRRGGRSWGLVCRFDFRADRMSTDFFRR